MISCVHVQRAHGLQYVGMVDSELLIALFVMPVGRSQQIKAYWIHFSPILMDLFILQVVQMP